MAFRTAIRFSAHNAFDYFELTPKYAIFEIETPGKWVDRTVSEVNVRNQFNVNILGVKRGDEIEPLLDPNYRFEAGMHLIVAGDKRDSIRFMDKI